MEGRQGLLFLAANFKQAKMKNVKNIATITQVITLENATKQRYNLLEDDYLRNYPIFAITARRQDANGDKVAVDGSDLVPNTVMGASFLTLQSNGFNFLDRLPMDYIAVNTDSENVTEKMFPVDLPNGFNPTKSFITIAETTNLSEGDSFEITFYYDAGEMVA